MSTLKLVVMLGFAVAFGAGLVTGMRVHRPIAIVDPVPVIPIPPSGTQPHHGPGPRPPLDQALKLTPEQKAESDRIWNDGLHGQRERDNQKRMEARKHKDAAIAAVIPAENKAAYEKALKDYSDELQQIDQEGRQAFMTTREKFLAILTPEQRTKFDEMSKEHGWRGRDRATTRPATQKN
jgi:Spy/CpxP family protein refolding chaperone